jgi:hypothetical protein
MRTVHILLDAATRIHQDLEPGKNLRLNTVYNALEYICTGDITGYRGIAFFLPASEDGVQVSYPLSPRWPAPKSQGVYHRCIYCGRAFEEAEDARHHAAECYASNPWAGDPEEQRRL